MDRLDPRSCVLVVVDVQERLAGAMPRDAMDRLLASTAVLLEAARILAVPVLASEQYPKGLGPTVAPLAEKLAAMAVTPHAKTTFDAASDPAFARALSELAPRSAVLVGMEAHICVFQTAREMARRGIDTHVVADAVASRREENRIAGLALCARAGACVSVAEAVAFDWVERAGTDAFRAVSKLVR